MSFWEISLAHSPVRWPSNETDELRWGQSIGSAVTKTQDNDCSSKHSGSPRKDGNDSLGSLPWWKKPKWCFEKLVQNIADNFLFLKLVSSSRWIQGKAKLMETNTIIQNNQRPHKLTLRRYTKLNSKRNTILRKQCHSIRWTR